MTAKERQRGQKMLEGLSTLGVWNLSRLLILLSKPFELVAQCEERAMAE